MNKNANHLYREGDIMGNFFYKYRLTKPYTVYVDDNYESEYTISDGTPVFPETVCNRLIISNGIDEVI